MGDVGFSLGMRMEYGLGSKTLALGLNRVWGSGSNRV